MASVGILCRSHTKAQLRRPGPALTSHSNLARQAMAWVTADRKAAPTGAWNGIHGRGREQKADVSYWRARYWRRCVCALGVEVGVVPPVAQSL